MAPRAEFSTRLHEILGSDNVYFQPGESVKLSYPCFVYSRDGTKAVRANNLVYVHTRRFTVTYISREADPAIIDNLLRAFPMCSYDRHFTADNLHHDVFTIYY